MATPPKRGRGRPPLTEAEKKKREKRAQKAKEEAAAKREKEREKKRLQKNAMNRKNRSKASQKLAERQQEALEKVREIDVNDLSVLLDGEDDRKIQGMIAADYFDNLPKVNMDNPIDVKNRLDFFFNCCKIARISPVIEWIALSLGIKWVSLKQIMLGERRNDSLQQEYILRTVLKMQSMWAYNGIYGQENPAEWCFRAKNYFGMKDNVEVTVATPVQPLGNAQSPEELAQKYQTALPKGIDVEYKEVAEEVVEDD